MTPIQSPKSPSFGSHPATPLTPSFNHPLDSQLSTPTSPRLTVVTTFPFTSLRAKKSPILGQLLASADLRTAHSGSGSSISTILFPSPVEAIFQHMPPTPKTPGPDVAFGSLFCPGSPVREDGRQSRLAMRSPIVERVLSLPLRVNSNGATSPPSESLFADPEHSRASTWPEDDAMSIASPFSSCRPIHTLTPVIQICQTPPPRSSSHTRNTSATSTATLKVARGSNKRPRSPPPHYHLTTAPSLCSTLKNSNPQRSSYHPFPTLAHRTAYSNAVTHLATPLVPLISVTTGLPHPNFPRSLLQYHLLTHDQLDSLARWYHQTHPATEESWMYPAWIPPYTAHAAAAAGQYANGTSGFEDVMLATKRRRWGRFIGLRGCESPTVAAADENENEEGLVERMEREWMRARDRAREEEIAREKGWRGRW